MASITYLTYRDGRYVWLGGYDTRAIPKEAGMSWDPNMRRWWTPNPEVALKLKSYADAAASEELNNHIRRQKQEMESSAATDADIYIPVPDGLAYLPYQKAGIAYAARRQAALIADEMGLGKTIQAIGLINYDISIRRVLVVCPASLKINWAREMDKWLVRKLSIGVASSTEWPETHVVIINYDIIDRHIEHIHSVLWDLLVLDEAHYVKNPDAKRTKLILGKRTWDPESGSWIVHQRPIEARKRLALTGTPILNRPQEFWNIVDFCTRHLSYQQKPEHFRSRTRFYARYAGYQQGYYGWEFTGPQNLEELQAEARRLFMVRRLKSQVLTELPPKIRQVIEVPSEGFERVLDEERKAYQNASDRIAEARSKMLVMRASGSEEEYREAVRELRAAYTVAFSDMAKVRHMVGVATLKAASALIEEILESGNKIVFFCHHHDVIHGLQEICEKKLGPGSTVLFYGEMSAENRQQSVDRFQNDKSVLVFIGSIQAAGLGITLTAASHVVFLELDWVPSNIAQAEDRLHRIGQPESVLVQHLVLQDSLTAHMAKVLVEKQQVIETALDGDYSSPYAQEVVAPGETESEVSTATRARIDVESEGITEEQVFIAQKFVQYLASVCDYASQLDYSGFNRYDAALGHALAKRDPFSRRDAVLARMLCRKYKRQLVAEFGEDEYRRLYR